MAEIVGFPEAFAAALAEVAPVLDERARRLLLGAGARQLGRGGIKLIAAATGAAADTVEKGAAELEAGIVADGRVRAPGAGPQTGVEHHDPELWPALDKLVDPETRGDPMSRLRWTTKSTVRLADELTAQGHRVGPDTVARLLKDHDYSLKATPRRSRAASTPTATPSSATSTTRSPRSWWPGCRSSRLMPSRRRTSGLIRTAAGSTSPKGSRWRPTPTTSSARQARQCPTGCTDVGANTGRVNVGTDADTGAFAVESIRRWWTTIGRLAYPGAKRLLITADGGGSNGSRLRLWKTQLAELAAQTGLQITVCHLPPGTSKWNKIEHRMFSAITMNWRGRPLETHEVVVETIAATTTTTGLTIQAELDTNTYRTRH